MGGTSQRFAPTKVAAPESETGGFAKSGAFAPVSRYITRAGSTLAARGTPRHGRADTGFGGTASRVTAFAAAAATAARVPEPIYDGAYRDRTFLGESQRKAAAGVSLALTRS